MIKIDIDLFINTKDDILDGEIKTNIENKNLIKEKVKKISKIVRELKNLK